MDPFTQRMLERAKSRREKLDNQKMIFEQRSPLQEKVNLNEKALSTETVTSKTSDNKQEKHYITPVRKSKLQKLAQFYSTNNENLFLEEDEDINEENAPCELERKSHCKLGRLNELASKIKAWEDDLDHPRHSMSNGEQKPNGYAFVTKESQPRFDVVIMFLCEMTKPIQVETDDSDLEFLSLIQIIDLKPSLNISRTSNLDMVTNLRNISLDVKGEASKRIKTNEQQTIWDLSMVQKLCSQGFSRSESQSRILYNFESKKEISKDEEKPKRNLQSSNSEPPTANETVIPKTDNSGGCRNEVLKKAAFFESTTRESPNKSTKDPAELSLAERKALFEKNIGEAFLHRIQIFPERNLKGRNGKPGKQENQTNETPASRHPQIEKKKNFFEGKLPQPEESIAKVEVTPKKADKALKADVCPIKEESLVVPEPPPLPGPCQNVSATPISKEEQREMDTLSPSSARLYPSLSNLDLTEDSGMSPSERDSFNGSKSSNLCLNMTLSELLELNRNNPTTPPSDQSFSQSKECQVLDKMDKLLEDALNDLSSESEDPSDSFPSPPKMKKSSSFEYRSGQESPNPLLHTVSFYRKQQQQQNSCAVVHGENVEKMDEEASEQRELEDESILVQNKIQTLIAEVNKQQTIISQASQALNLCLSTVEFSGSGEQVEGERLLLLASHKRQACLNEVQRLKVENSLRPQGSSFLTERGDVNLTNISIKLKRDALRSIAAAENLQYFVCLIKSDEQVLATPAVSAAKENLKDMALQFPGQIKLEGLLSNFKITVEVYNLELSKELLPHDVKYHLVNKKEKKLLTPIKSKKSESKLVKPNIQSPAGPNAVRTTNFQMCGYIVFSLREISRTQWILNKVPYVSPVEGTISMTIQSHLRLNDEFRGFLTMFDDISGFGAWHRRWCLLSSHFISYWKYPDDEIKKVPIGTIDLRSVVTESVGLVSRDICARLNTFLLETTRPRLNEDKNSLVVRVKDDVTIIRHLLSADSKQEMMTWCKKLNTALALLRSWKCNSSE